MLPQGSYCGEDRRTVSASTRKGSRRTFFLLITTKIESAMKYPKLSILAVVFVLGTAFGIYVVSQDRLD